MLNVYLYIDISDVCSVVGFFDEVATLFVYL